ncbi:MAG: aldehyde dehydrogenase family protein, partial [Bacteroidota bacterium]
VIVKAHPSHLGTNALVSEAIIRAAQKCGMPDGVYSTVQDDSYAVGTQLVQHPDVKAVAFTGSMRGGMALHKAAMERPEPIPVFAEMGSTNPVFIMPDLLKSNPDLVARQVTDSVNLGAGQFCTNPGMVIVLDDDYTAAFVSALVRSFGEKDASTMLNEGIYKGFEQQKNAFFATEHVEVTFLSPKKGSDWKGFPAVASTTARAILHNPKLHEEVFGPFTLVIKCKDLGEMKAVAEELHGQLTATIMGPEDKLIKWNELARLLQEKVGRLIFNGLPTGVEVGFAMQHGGPFPATTDSRFTSVGTDAIKRFARPIAFQNCPDALLPPALKIANPLNLIRTVNGEIAQH